MRRKPEHSNSVAFWGKMMWKASVNIPVKKGDTIESWQHLPSAPLLKPFPKPAQNKTTTKTRKNEQSPSQQTNKNKQKNPTPTYRRSTTGRKNSNLRWKYMNSTNILKQETGKCVEQTYRKSILHLLETESEFPFLIFCYSEICSYWNATSWKATIDIWFQGRCV